MARSRETRSERAETGLENWETVTVTKLRVHSFALSLDGYAAVPDQSTKDPLGVRGEELHEWMFAEDRDPAADKFVDLGIEGIGATIMGRNMSARPAERATTIPGPGGGARTRRSTTRCSC